MRKTPALNSTPWVELAALAPGHSHYWFFEPAWDAYGWVFQATAYPELPDAEETRAPSRVEVTELFVARLKARAGDRDSKCDSRVNVTVTNCGQDWASYSLWVASIPPRRATHLGRRHGRIRAPLTAARAG